MLDDICRKCGKAVYGRQILVDATTYDIYVDVSNVVYKCGYFVLFESVIVDLLQASDTHIHLQLVLDNFWTLKDFAGKFVKRESCNSPCLRRRNMQHAYNQMCEMIVRLQDDAPGRICSH